MAISHFSSSPFVLSRPGLLAYYQLNLLWLLYAERLLSSMFQQKWVANLIPFFAYLRATYD